MALFWYMVLGKRLVYESGTWFWMTGQLNDYSQLFQAILRYKNFKTADFIGPLKGENALKPLFCNTCAIITTYQYILIILGNFYIVSIWDLYGPETAVTWHSGRKNVVKFTENISAK